VALPVVLDLTLAHGLCVAMTLPESDAEVLRVARSVLLPEERAFAEKQTERRRRTWVGGRVALRRVLDALGVEAGPLLPNTRGAPTLPAGIAASISHKETLAVALAAIDGEATRGVDVEIDAPRRVDVSRHVLTAEEEKLVAAQPKAARASEVLLRFSIKEAIYKALDPYLNRYVAFREVSVFPDGGAARVEFHLQPNEGPFLAETTYSRTGGLILSTAKVSSALRGQKT
jgi:4'-phosphopantetheinyl transferase EntD